MSQKEMWLMVIYAKLQLGSAQHIFQSPLDLVSWITGGEIVANAYLGLPFLSLIQDCTPLDLRYGSDLNT